MPSPLLLEIIERLGENKAEEVRRLGSPGAVTIYTSGIPQNSLHCVCGVVFSGVNHAETCVPPAQHCPQVVGSHQLMEELSPVGRLGKRGFHCPTWKDTQKPS